MNLQLGVPGGNGEEKLGRRGMDGLMGGKSRGRVGVRSELKGNETRGIGMGRKVRYEKSAASVTV